MDLKLSILLYLMAAIKNGYIDCKLSFRKDYDYFSSTDAFYKFHSQGNTWEEAKAQCELENATLFFPETKFEATQVLGYWNQTESEWYIGIGDVDGEFKTVDGRLVDLVHNEWNPGEPNNYAGGEDCVMINKNALLNDIPCTSRRPFFCKKVLKELSTSTITPRLVVETTTFLITENIQQSTTNQPQDKEESSNKSAALNQITVEPNAVNRSLILQRQEKTIIQPDENERQQTLNQTKVFTAGSSVSMKVKTALIWICCLSITLLL